MNRLLATCVALACLAAGDRTAVLAASPARPNVLFIIADDASCHFGCYGCRWTTTPQVDALAAQGVVFDAAYVPTSKCAPCRAGLLTGRYPWQLEEAANHQCAFPPQFGAFTEALATEIEAFDREVGELMAALRESGRLENTLVVITSDHGMPFPRVKGHTFELAHRVPLVVSWPAGIANPGRRCGQLVSLVDLIRDQPGAAARHAHGRTPSAAGSTGRRRWRHLRPLRLAREAEAQAAVTRRRHRQGRSVNAG